MVCSNDPVCFTLPVFEDRFTSSELDELLSFFQPTGNAADANEPCEPIPSSNSGSDNSTNPEDSDEKKERRKISNRESARRSRLRKKTYIENLRVQANRLKSQSQEYTKRLTLILNQLYAVTKQNELFRFESECLIRRHAELNRVLLFTRFPQYKNNVFANNLNFGRCMDGNGALFS